MKGMLHCIPGPFNEKDRTELYSIIAKEVNNAKQDWIEDKTLKNKQPPAADLIQCVLGGTTVSHQLSAKPKIER